MIHKLKSIVSEINEVIYLSSYPSFINDKKYHIINNEGKYVNNKGKNKAENKKTVFDVVELPIHKER